MNTTRLITVAAVAAIAGMVPFAGRTESAAAAPEEAMVLHAQRFELAQPYIHWWRAEQPRHTGGWLLVLKTDAQKLRPSQLETPVLYVGAETAERINVGDHSGRVVVLVPGDVELTEAPIYWGEPALPERVDAAHIDRELQRARDRGVRPTADERMIAVLHDTRRFANENQLRRAAVDLVEQYSPTERDLIRGMRVPLLK